MKTNFLGYEFRNHLDPTILTMELTG